MERSDSLAGHCAPWDELFYIDQCVSRILALGVQIERERAEVGDNGRMVWQVTCVRGAERFLAEGSSPLEAWRRVVGRALDDSGRQRGLTD